MILTDNFHSHINLTTPVLFLVFNRPEQSKLVFESIRTARPSKLFFASDGPRRTIYGEEEKVMEIRELINEVDWDCEVFTLFRDNNLGCKYAVSGAISWFFDNVEEGIVLEDDCLPSQSFFWFCQIMLKRYRFSNEIAVVGGTNFDIEMRGSYAFTKYPMIWGWASWASVWQNYDVEISDWPVYRKQILNSHRNIRTRRFWQITFDNLYRKKVDTWDYQLGYLLQRDSKKCIVPKYNLISNIGFGRGATHTVDLNSHKSNLRTHEINFNFEFQRLSEDHIVVDTFLDKNEFFIYTSLEVTLIRIKNKLRLFKVRESCRKFL